MTLTDSRPELAGGYPRGVPARLPAHELVVAVSVACNAWPRIGRDKNARPADGPRDDIDGKQGIWFRSVRVLAAAGCCTSAIA